MIVGHDAYERRQHRLVVLAALDPEVTNVNLSQLKAIRGLLEDRLQSLEPDVRSLAPDLEPGSIEVVVFPQSAGQTTSTYFILVRCHDQGFSFTVLDNPGLAQAIDRAAMEIENSVKLFLRLRRQHLARPGQLVAGAVF